MTVAASLLVLAGCGDDDPTATASDPSSSSSEPTTADSTTPSETPSEAPSEAADPLPACSDIWVDDGRKLPGRYQGCSENGTDVPAAARQCSFGQALVTYGDHYYAVPRGPINRTKKPLAQDRDYKSALASCTA